MLITALALTLAASPLDDPIPGYELEQQLAKDAIAAFEGHPSGPDAFDYFACYRLHETGGHFLFQPSYNHVFPSPFDIWYADPVRGRYTRSGPTRDSWAALDGFILTAVLLHFDEIGFERCQRVLRRYEVTLDDLFELQERNREARR